MNKYIAIIIFFVLVFGVHPMTGMVVVALALIGTWPGGVQDLWKRVAHLAHHCPHCELCQTLPAAETHPDDRHTL